MRKAVCHYHIWDLAPVTLAKLKAAAGNGSVNLVRSQADKTAIATLEIEYSLKGSAWETAGWQKRKGEGVTYHLSMRRHCTYCECSILNCFEMFGLDDSFTCNRLTELVFLSKSQTDLFTKSSSDCLLVDRLRGSIRLAIINLRRADRI